MSQPDCARKRPLSASTSAEPGPIRNTARACPGATGLPGWFSSVERVPSSRSRRISPVAVAKMPPPVWSAKPGVDATSACAWSSIGWKGWGFGCSVGSEGALSPHAASRPASSTG